MRLPFRVVAVLETMWGGPRGRAPRYFKINPYNKSGQRLYKLVGDLSLVVTNACREMVSHARHHGKPDPEWLLENLKRLRPDLILVCGKVAKRTYKKSGYKPDGCKVMFILHPAARTWTKASIKRTTKRIAKYYTLQLDKETEHASN